MTYFKREAPIKPLRVRHVPIMSPTNEQEYNTLVFVKNWHFEHGKISNDERDITRHGNIARAISRKLTEYEQRGQN